MPNWKKVIVSGSDAVLNSLNVTTALTASGLNYPTADGTANQVIQTDGLGNLSFGSVDTTYEVVKNVAGTTLYKGTPVHATASNALGNVIGIIAASASNPATMPATFILNEDLADEAEGYAIISGLVQGVDTSAFEEGDVVYVGENSGYTNVKPTGSNLIQNLGIVTKIHPSNGAGIVLGAGRSNDVPNLLNGEVFWGENNRSIQKPLAHILSGSSYTYSGSFSGSFQGDGSGLTGIVHYTDADTLSYINTLGVVSSSAQLSDTTIPGNLTIEGKLTAQEFHTEYVSASIIYESGSTKFGDTLDDTHTFIGSLDVSGSVSIDGKIALNDGGNSVYIGDDAGRLDDGSDNRNVGVGHQALYNNTTGDRNTANGYLALYNNTTGYNNVANGREALKGNTTGYNNTSNGNEALSSNTTGNSNTANGSSALYSNTTGIRNTANGERALYSNTTGHSNVANGFEALYSDTTGIYNIANGVQALYSNTTGGSNVANGYAALLSNTTGAGNIANGYQALRNNTTGGYNTANGYGALFSNTTGYRNIANGTSALQNNTTGIYNLANGTFALYSNTAGSANTANGYQALFSLATGSNNTAEGYRAGRYQVGTTDPLTEINSSIFIGTNTKGTLSATNENVFGYGAEGNGSNSVTIGNTSVTKTIINGNLGLGTTSPSEKLEVVGKAIVRRTGTATAHADTDLFVTDATAAVSTAQIEILGGNAGNSILYFSDSDNYSQGAIQYLHSTDSMNIRVNGNTAMTIDSFRNVGIGTTSPSHKLDIAGDVRILSSSLSYQENIDVDSAATEVVATVSISDYDAAFFDYVIKSGTNLRAGTVTAVHDGTSVEYNEVSTQDLGTTTGVTLSVDISGTDLRLLATTTTDNWTVKSLVRTL